MGEELLVNAQIDAGAEFIRDFNDYLRVTVAFWVATAESDDAYLYIASDSIEDSNIDVAYGEVLRRLQGNRTQRLDPFRIKLVNSTDPIAQQAIEIRDRYPAPLVTRYHGSSMGGISINDACIYPPVDSLKVTP